MLSVYYMYTYLHLFHKYPGMFRRLTFFIL